MPELYLIGAFGGKRGPFASTDEIYEKCVKNNFYVSYQIVDAAGDVVETFGVSVTSTVTKLGGPIEPDKRFVLRSTGFTLGTYDYHNSAVQACPTDGRMCTILDTHTGKEWVVTATLKAHREVKEC